MISAFNGDRIVPVFHTALPWCHCYMNLERTLTRVSEGVDLECDCEAPVSVQGAYGRGWDASAELTGSVED